jgi:putative nucleotidyltransferase with HDIG domain
VRILYRSRQFWLALTARPTPEELSLAEGLLGESLMMLFTRMQPGEQSHSITICQKLIAQGVTQTDLLTAALLHDVGKSRHPLTTWERVVVVLGKAFFPGRVHAWGKGQPRGWKKAFVVAEQHPAWGAQMAAQAGASSRTVAVIRYHQENVTHENLGDEQVERWLIQLKNLDEEH